MSNLLCIHFLVANDSGRVLHILWTAEHTLTQPIARAVPIPLGATEAQLYLPESLIRLFANFPFGFTAQIRCNRLALALHKYIALIEELNCCLFQWATFYGLAAHINCQLDWGKSRFSVNELEKFVSLEPILQLFTLHWIGWVWTPTSILLITRILSETTFPSNLL